jgi:hypothetical protein
MKKDNQEKVYQGSDPYLVELYVLGHEVQWYNEGYWIDIPCYTEDGIDDDICRITNKNYDFRIKPKDIYVFFHNCSIDSSITYSSVENIMLFNYPKFSPSGAYTMFRVRNNIVIDSYSCMTEEINDEFFS